eukprot:m.234322 g.234322  ORF g.234322 m.234322 type:complete len:57 (+) comp15255_c1_seq1:1996-2166(+)
MSPDGGGVVVLMLSNGEVHDVQFTTVQATASNTNMNILCEIQAPLSTTNCASKVSL